MFDLIIENGSLIDGVGGAARSADIGIVGQRVSAIGDLCGAAAVRRLDASGKVVCPGFIDLHTHCGYDPKHLTGGVNLNYLQQGVTTVVGGNCGFSPTDFGFVTANASAVLDGPNLAMFIGHNSLRLAVMGLADRDPRPEELDAMQALTSRAMVRGAIGFSSGPFYVRGTYSEPAEIAALSRVAAEHGGLYATHIRSESDGLVSAVAEALDVGHETGVRVQLSHHKAQGPANWGRSVQTLAMIDEARQEGLDVALDQYPYTASCSRLGTLMPSWVCAGSDEEAQARLSDPETRAVIREALVDTFSTLYGGDLARIQIASSVVDPSLSGLTFAEVAAWRQARDPLQDLAEFVMDLAWDHPASCDTMCTSHLMCEDDLVRILEHPFTVVASDGWGVSTGEGHPHPRLYGTFPRVLGRYCREKGVLTLEEAVRRMTSLPAARLNLAGRGVLCDGSYADVVVFNPATVSDRSTFEDPHRYPEGIDYVLVNGEVVIEHGAHSGALPGLLLGRIPASGHVDELK